jgi:squalene-hopene/tetraprenyl-beta-curcumene cyclase
MYDLEDNLIQEFPTQQHAADYLGVRKQTIWNFLNSYISLKGKGDSTASQTAWALIGLIAAGEATDKLAIDSIEKGINYLLETQKLDGTWDEEYFTGTGFPCHFYLKYHLYQQYFPLMALGRYQAKCSS